MVHKMHGSTQRRRSPFTWPPRPRQPKHSLPTPQRPRPTAYTIQPSQRSYSYPPHQRGLPSLPTRHRGTTTGHPRNPTRLSAAHHEHQYPICGKHKRHHRSLSVRPIPTPWRSLTPRRPPPRFHVQLPECHQHEPRQPLSSMVLQHHLPIPLLLRRGNRSLQPMDQRPGLRPQPTLTQLYLIHHTYPSCDPPPPLPYHQITNRNHLRHPAKHQSPYPSSDDSDDPDYLRKEARTQTFLQDIHTSPDDSNAVLDSGAMMTSSLRQYGNKTCRRSLSHRVLRPIDRRQPILHRTCLRARHYCSRTCRNFHAPRGHYQ